MHIFFKTPQKLEKWFKFHEKIFRRRARSMAFKKIKNYVHTIITSEDIVFFLNYWYLIPSPYGSDYCTWWHLVTIEIQKCNFLNNQERYEHAVLFCLKVLFQSIFNNKMDDFWEDHHLQFLIFEKVVLRNFSA